MENSSRIIQESKNPSLIASSPKSHSTNSSSSSTSSSNGLHHHQLHHVSGPPTPPPLTPVPITRSEPNNPYPTTFVQADTTSFKQVVQMLTGSSETAKVASGSNRPQSFPSKNHSIPPIKTGPRKEKSTSKLYERRNSLKNFKLSPLAPGLVNKPGFSVGYSGSPRVGTPEILSPSLLDFPSLALSPVTPLIPDPFNRSPHVGVSSNGNLDAEAEEIAIAKKGYFLHPSPSNTPRDSEPPRLLPLFPLTSPRVAGSSSSDS